MAFPRNSTARRVGCGPRARLQPVELQLRRTTPAATVDVGKVGGLTWSDWERDPDLTDSISLTTNLALILFRSPPIDCLGNFIEAGELWVGRDGMEISVSTMKHEHRSVGACDGTILGLHGTIEAIWGRAAIRRKQASHTYTATVLAFGSSWMR